MIALIHPRATPADGSSVPPIALCSLAATLKAKGRTDVRGYDLQVCNTFDLDLKTARWVGITSMSYGFREAVAAARRVRDLTPAPIVLGGAHASMMRETILKEFPEFEYVVVGEGEERFARLIRGDSPSEIDGLAWRSMDGLHYNPVTDYPDVDALPPPDWGLFSRYPYTDFPGSITMETSRGCPFDCSFCGTRYVNGRAIRFKTTERVLQEISTAVHEYAVRNIALTDDNFVVDRSRAMAIAQGLIDLDLGISLRASARADCVDAELLVALKRAGLKAVGFGIESANPHVLGLVHKGVSIERVTRAVHEAKEAGLHVRGYFIVGLPGDTLASWRQTMRWIEASGLDSIGINLALPHPGTPMFEWVQEHGRFLTDPLEHLYDFGNTPPLDAVCWDTPDFPREERIIAYREALQLRNRMGRSGIRILSKALRLLSRGQLTVTNVKYGMRLLVDYLRTGYLP